MALIDIYVNEYLGKIFYYCLKKTGKENDAAELASNINFEVIKALQKGGAPEKFSQWVWTVAKNQWSKWAKKQYFSNLEQVDIRDYEQELASEENAFDKYIHSEDLKILRRELAFIREDYRQILVAHYFEEMSVSAIAQKYNIPIGTVKTKLQTSRRILKEGMDMAREFGKRSFNPEVIHFTASGSQPSGLPWKAVERLLPINILCEANNNPCTIEELSMELGIAVPYMTEEVSLLEKAELLRKVEKDKYITGFFIAPRECLNEINELCCKYAEDYYATVWNLAEKIWAHIKEQGHLRGTLSEIDEKAYIAFRVEQCLDYDTVTEEIYTKFHRNDGGTWGFMGRETGDEYRLNLISFSNNIAMNREGVKWNGFQCDEYYKWKLAYGNKIYAEDTPENSFLNVMKSVAATGGMEVASIPDIDKDNIGRLVADGFCKEVDRKIQINALVFTSAESKEIQEYLRSLQDYKSLQAGMYDLMGKTKQVISKYSVPYLEDDFDYYVAMSNVNRHIMAALWKDKGLYTGNSCQFCALIYE